MWTSENDPKTLRVDANIFENGEKKLRFQMKTDTCGRGLTAGSIRQRNLSAAFYKVFHKANIVCRLLRIVQFNGVP